MLLAVYVSLPHAFGDMLYLNNICQLQYMLLYMFHVKLCSHGNSFK